MVNIPIFFRLGQKTAFHESRTEQYVGEANGIPRHAYNLKFYTFAAKKKINYANNYLIEKASLIIIFMLTAGFDACW